MSTQPESSTPINASSASSSGTAVAEVPGGEVATTAPTNTMMASVSPPAKFGAIDVGSNSVHLIMAEISPEGDFRIVGRDKEMVQLGKGGFARHVLTHRAMQEGLAALKRFVKMANLKGIKRLRAVATSAVREATNGGDFVEAVRSELGLELHVISAEEEARLIYLAVRHAVDLGVADNLIMDIGGGSLEMVVGDAGDADVLVSAKLGASRLGELYLRSDPPAESELKALRRHTEETLEPIVKRIGKRDFARCIGTSGTVENIATACAYRRGATEIEPVTQLRVTRSELKALLADLSTMTNEERRQVPGIDSRRVDSIVPGISVLLAVMQAFDIDELEHCDMALREGVILDDIARHQGYLRARAMWPDPRARSVVYLGERCQYHAGHAEHVSGLATSLFDQLRPLHRLSSSYREPLKYASMLHDVGYLISHRGHHKHSYYLIRNGRLQGFSELEIEVMANIARYHRKGRPKKSHYSWQNLPNEHRPAVRKLIAIARLANALDRTHDRVVDSVTCRIKPKGVDVLVHTRKDAELELWTARRQAALFERELGLPVRIVLSDAQPRETGHGRQR